MEEMASLERATPAGGGGWKHFALPRGHSCTLSLGFASQALLWKGLCNWDPKKWFEPNHYCSLAFVIGVCLRDRFHAGVGKHVHGWELLEEGI